MYFAFAEEFYVFEEGEWVSRVGWAKGGRGKRILILGGILLAEVGATIYTYNVRGDSVAVTQKAPAEPALSDHT